MARRILTLSVTCLLALTMIVTPGCGGGEKKEDTPPASESPKTGPSDAGEKKSPEPAAPSVPLGGKWTRSRDGLVFEVKDEGGTLTGTLATDPKGTYESYGFVLRREGGDLVGKAKFKVKDGPEAETAWKVHPEGSGDAVVAETETVALDDSGEVADFLGRRVEKQPFTVVRPEPPKTEAPKTEEPPAVAVTPKTEEPKAEPPKTEEPKAEPPKTEEPKTETPPKTEEPKAEPPVVVAPKTEEPKAEPPKTEPAMPTIKRHSAIVHRASGEPVRGIVYDRGAELIVRTPTGDVVVAKADVLTVGVVPATPEEIELADRPAPGNAPVEEAPKAEPPRTEPPKTEEPKAEPPKTEEPKAEPPKTEEPKAEPPKTEEPKAEPPKTEEPKAEPPKTEEPKAEPPKTEEPKAEPPKTEEPKVETPKVDAPSAEPAKAATATDLLHAIFDGLHAKDRAALERFAPTRDELVQAVGEKNADRVLASVTDGINKEYGRLLADNPALVRGSWVDTAAPSLEKVKLVPSDPNVVEVETVRNASLSYEVDGAKKTVTIAQLFRVGDGGWKILRLVPKK